MMMENNNPATWEEAASSAPPSFDLLKGTFFDSAIDLRNPEGEAITEDIVALIGAVENRKRKRRPADEAAFQIHVRKILANGFRCHFYRKPPLVAYSRRSERYPGSPPWYSGRTMGKIIDTLVDFGLLANTKGKHGEVSSTYYVTEALQALAQGFGITEDSLTSRQPSECLVRLREGKSGTPYIAIKSSEETDGWAASLETYNSFLVQQDIRLELSEEDKTEWLANRNKKKRDKYGQSTPLLCRPELFQTDLYRQFNNGSFDLGGRLYGGWWINTPSELRSKITINGKPTVELDYSGCAIRMLYHERGIDYQGDPYHLDEIASYEQQEGKPAGYFRDAIKTMVQALINEREGGRGELIRLSNVSFRPGFTRPEVRKMIKEKHAPIADAFGTRAGLRLQRKDSDLALSIITELRELGVVALPIHDSFLVPEENKEILSNRMNYHYRDMFGFHPIIRP